MVLKRYPKFDQRYAILCQMSAKRQPSEKNLSLTLRSGSLKTVHTDYVRLSPSI